MGGGLRNHGKFGPALGFNLQHGKTLVNKTFFFYV